MNGWLYLLLGILFEVMGTICLKLSDGFSQLLPSILCFGFFATALSLISLSAKTIDISIVYAIWSGAGIVILSLVGMFYFSEQINVQKIVCILLILVGIVGLHHYHAQTERESHDIHSIK